MKNKGMITQHFDIIRSSIDVDKRKMTVSFSSETPLTGGYYTQLLMHDEDSIDLSLLETGASLLLNHNPDIVLGTVNNPRIEDRRGKADITFDKDEESEKWFQKVINGSVTGISVGGNPVSEDDTLWIEQGNFEYRDGEYISGPAMIYTYWRPHEISLTPIPADTSVGVNRTLNEGEENMKLEDIIKGLGKSEELATMIKQAVETAIKPVVELAVKQAMEKGAIEETEVDDKGIKTPPDPLMDNQDLIKRAELVSIECKSEVTDMIMQKKTEAEISTHIVTKAMTEKGTTLNQSNDNNDLNMDDDAFINGFKS